jgi:hypothetical protein
VLTFPRSIPRERASTTEIHIHGFADASILGCCAVIYEVAKQGELVSRGLLQGSNFIAAIAAIALEGEQNAVDHCGNDGNFLPYSAILYYSLCITILILEFRC